MRNETETEAVETEAVEAQATEAVETEAVEAQATETEATETEATETEATKAWEIEITEEEHQAIEAIHTRRKAVVTLQNNLIAQLLEVEREDKKWWDDIHKKYDCPAEGNYMLNRTTRKVTVR